jgi:hypothetical protein
VGGRFTVIGVINDGEEEALHKDALPIQVVNQNTLPKYIHFRTRETGEA